MKIIKGGIIARCALGYFLLAVAVFAAAIELVVKHDWDGEEGVDARSIMNSGYTTLTVGALGIKRGDTVTFEFKDGTKQDFVFTAALGTPMWRSVPGTIVRPGSGSGGGGSGGGGSGGGWDTGGGFGGGSGGGWGSGGGSGGGWPSANCASPYAIGCG